MSIQYVITVTPAQDKALRSIAVDVQALIDNYVQQRAAVEIDAIVRREIDRKRAAGEPVNGTDEEIVLAADVPSAAERSAQQDSARALQLQLLNGGGHARG